MEVARLFFVTCTIGKRCVARIRSSRRVEEKISGSVNRCWRKEGTA